MSTLRADDRDNRRHETTREWNPVPDPPRDWYDDAACIGQDHLFGLAFEIDLDDVNDECKAVCARCPVIDQCRATFAAEKHGVWFGTTAGERRG